MAKRKNVEAGACLAVALAALAAACNFVSTDGLEASGTGDGGTTTIIIVESPDATTGTTAVVDASNAMVVDSAGEQDASGDQEAADASDGAIADASVADTGADAGPFCATPANHTLCFDFEEGSLLFAYSNSGSTAYLSNDIFGAGVMGLTTMGPLPFPSPPTAFLSSVTGADAAVTAQSGSSIQYVAPSANVSRFELSAEMYLSQNSQLQYGSAAVLSFNQISSKGSYSYTNVGWSPMGLQIANVVLEQADASSPVQTVRAALPFSPSWQHVHMIVTRTAPMGHLFFQIGNDVAVDEDMPTLAADTKTVVMELGLNTNGGTPPIGVLFDDVAVDVAF